MSVNSSYIKNVRAQGPLADGTDYVNRTNLLNDWNSDMGAGTPEGPKTSMIAQFIDASGPTVDWLAAAPYNFHFVAPGAFSFFTYNGVCNYGSENWNSSDGTYADDDGLDLFKTRMFTQAIDIAKARTANSTDLKSDYKLELRATKLFMDGNKVVGVGAEAKNGTKYEVYGKTVILATGGFIGNPDMKRNHFGTSVRTEAVDTDQGDGITMAIRDASAGTYNIDMPAMVHIAQVQNIIQNKLFPNDPALDTKYKTTLTSLLLKGDNLVVGLKNTRK
ncbi:hypothetical protein AGMMS4952_27750 [Spirochaetia bacterium]|nr:hypothetical protein AGMMS4952_27750 [Spirochaetia bacterium]